VTSVFGRPRRLATRAAAAQFMATHYRRFSGQKTCPAPLPTVPNDYHQQLRGSSRRLRLAQDGLARRIGAAGEAVIYQWESRKRTPSPVLWQPALRSRLVVFDGISLTARRHEFVTIVGPSGCGKTTLLNCIAGLLDYDHGSICLDGLKITRPGLDLV
jgi:ABC-type multidrug transport system fused ATPase/permease subunit